jgi:hypothetical protein
MDRLGVEVAQAAVTRGRLRRFGDIHVTYVRTNMHERKPQRDWLSVCREITVVGKRGRGSVARTKLGKVRRRFIKHYEV